MFLPVLALLLASCSSNFRHVEFDSREKKIYVDDLMGMREQKDVFFKTSTESPLTSKQKASFKHLDYYPVNFVLIFQVKLLREFKRHLIGIQATGGETRPAIDYGEFHFEVDGKRVTLHVYKMLPDSSGDLFVPFTDLTCGKTSYSGGRYIDLRENKSDVYSLDFNYAYNPYCAYNHSYSCPIVPKENHLDVPVKAGEMKFGNN